jgi:uncharacterized protein (DUF1778 family)
MLRLKRRKKEVSLMGMPAWLRERWDQVLKPALITYGVAQEEDLRQVWEAELVYWRQARHLKPNSLRKPITWVRHLIRDTLPLTAENGWFNAKNQKREHIGLHVCNLPEEEWVHMNAVSQGQVQNREVKLIEEPELVVEVGRALLSSEDWAEIVVGLALCTGRRLAEILVTGSFTEATDYTVIFAGQLKTKERTMVPYEIPTLAPASLVLSAVERVRGMLDLAGIDEKQVSRVYGKQVNEAAERRLSLLILARTSRQTLFAHVFRSIYPTIACFWFQPPWVQEIGYRAHILGHWYIVSPQVQAGDTEAKVEQRRYNYATEAHYFDYKIGDGHGGIDGRVGIKLGEPDVQILTVFQKPAEDLLPKGAEERKNVMDAHKKRHTLASMPVALGERLDVIGQRISPPPKRALKRSETIQMLADAFEGGKSREEREGTATIPAWTLASLPVDEETKKLLQEGMSVSGVQEVVTFLVNAGLKEAKQVLGQQKRREQSLYESLPTSDLSRIKLPEATEERLRRAVYTVMQWNETHGELERWYLNIATLQNLVGGRKPMIKAHLEAHRAEIEEHHQQFDPPITPAYNRKPIPIEKMITLPEQATAYPWGREPEKETTSAKKKPPSESLA